MVLDNMQTHMHNLYGVVDVYIQTMNRIVGMIDSVLTSSAVDRGFEARSGQTKDYEIGICYFSAKHTAIRRKSKY